jgi:general secretion pathway protein D
VYLERISRFITQVDTFGDTTARRLHVYYIQNGTASDLAAILRRAFAPQTGSSPGMEDIGSLAPGTEAATVSSSAPPPDAPATGFTAQPGGRSPGPTTSGMSSGLSSGGSARTFGASRASSTPVSQNATGSFSQEQEASAKGMRFIADGKNNALLIFATPDEYKMIEATLIKIDILPLQVLVEATVAEVTLNDNLQYGTQFFFKSGNFATTLSNANNGAVNPEFPGFAFAFSASNAQIALSALKSVTTVKVVSDPQLLVLNNESARLQVGDLVPITTQTAVSTTTAGAPIVNTVDYKETGVIIEVTPRVNSGGLVSLEIQQEVSDVVRTSTSTIDSPTIRQRKIKTRIVAQDGETIGLGGLIKDSDTVGNAGIPWLTDVPVLGALFGTRNRAAARTELLILLTPRVIRDQRTVRALTEDLRAKLGALGSIPIERDPIEPPGPLRH